MKCFSSRLPVQIHSRWLQSGRCGLRYRGLKNLNERPFSTSRDVSKEGEKVQTFKVTCGSAGSITVDLHNARLLAEPTTPLYIYIPSHGTHLPQTQTYPSFLPPGPKALATINYRWNHIPQPRGPSTSSALLSSHPSYPNHPFPTPLHDTAHAFEYLTTSLLTKYTTASLSQAQKQTRQQVSDRLASSPKKQPQRPIIITGSRLGGTLATSLALTESVISKHLPYYIAGLIVKDAVFDWTTIASTLPPTTTTTTPPEKSWTASYLHTIKESLFTKPEGTFDNFISPVLFFRTAGQHVLPEWRSEKNPEGMRVVEPTEDAEWVEEIGSIDDEYSPPPPTPPSSRPNSRSSAGKTITYLDLPPPRKSPLKFPPASSDLKIPRSVFLVTPSSPLNSRALKNGKRKKNGGKERDLEIDDFITPQEQAEEMAGLMGRSITTHEMKDRKMWDESLDPEQEAGERVNVVEIGSDEVERIEEWIEESLR